MVAFLSAYWAMYTRMKHYERYYWHYCIRARRWVNFITGLCLLASAASIATWKFWGNFPWAWAGVIAAAQIVQALSPTFPFAAQLSAFKYLNKEMDSILVSIRHDWLMIETYSDKKIADLISQYERQYCDLCAKYTNDVHMPEVKRCARKAKNDSIHYFRHNYDIGGEIIEQSKPA